ncbi:MAG TPA: universal stress protein [Steroidobacteraceae bacterium]|nr:universal stress protein [Steroidobacteraceae bacterium]
MLEAPALHPYAVRFAERNVAHDPIRKIMVVIDPTALSHACLEKAGRIALAFGGSIEIFSCIPPADLPEAWAGGTTLAAYRGVLRERQMHALERLAKPLRAHGVAVTVDCVCTARVPEAIVEHAIRCKADLVVKNVAVQPSPAPRAASQLDWLLIRAMPVPLLLARPGAWPSHPRICVAVDPCHPGDRPAALDDALIGAGNSLGRALSGVVQLVHTLQSPPHLPGEVVAPTARQQAHAHAREAVEQLAHRAGIAQQAIHYVAERIPEGILKLADESGADIVVMGAGARPRVQYSAASTASLVLEQSNCDLLVVKAPGFVSPILVE